MILFLDFDGVLHPIIANGSLFSCLPRLEKVLRDHPEVKIVISSAWRYSHDLEALRDYFSPDIRPRIISTTPVTNESRGIIIIGQERHLEILTWIEQNAYKGPWIALDDAHKEFPEDCEELIRCYPRDGFDEAVELELRRAILPPNK